MEETILITYLNDFIFCPLSIYYHHLYGNTKSDLYNTTKQVDGLISHESIDNAKYSSDSSVLQGIDVYSSRFNLMGNIDVFYINDGKLVERKNLVTKIYDGYIFQLYGQYYALEDMGYDVKKLVIHSYSDNKNYNIALPPDDKVMDLKFRKLIDSIKSFDISNYIQNNLDKCRQCIYSPNCDRSLDVK